MFKRLASFYFFYFALLGAMVPYLGLYFDSLGMSVLEISQLMSVLMLTKVLAPNIWGIVADRTGRRLLLVRLGSVMTALSFLGFFWVDGFWALAFVMVLYSFFWNAVLAQFEVVTLHNLGVHQDRYSLVRLWGSIGFIAAVVLLGWVLERYGVSLLPWAMLIIMALIAGASQMRFREPENTANDAHPSPGFIGTLKQPVVVAFFLSCLLLQISHGAYYTFYSIYLEDQGYSKIDIGLLWALGVLAEVVLFMGMHHWLRRHSDLAIMCIALLGSALRWLMIAYGVESLAVVVIAQVLHALSFGAMHAAAIHFVHRTFATRTQGRAQALYSSMGFGLGGAIGAFVSGGLVSQLSYTAAFGFSAALAAMGALLLFRYVSKSNHEATAS